MDLGRFGPVGGGPRTPWAVNPDPEFFLLTSNENSILRTLPKQHFSIQAVICAPELFEVTEIKFFSHFFIKFELYFLEQPRTPKFNHEPLHTYLVVFSKQKLGTPRPVSYTHLTLPTILLV